MLLDREEHSRQPALLELLDRPLLVQERELDAVAALDGVPELGVDVPQLRPDHIEARLKKRRHWVSAAQRGRAA